MAMVVVQYRSVWLEPNSEIRPAAGLHSRYCTRTLEVTAFSRARWLLRAVRGECEWDVHWLWTTSARRSALA